jgi:hypothetical protein
MFMAQRAFTMRLSSLLPLATFALTALLVSPLAQAAPAEVAPVGAPFSLVGSTFNGQGFDLAKQKGRVVMVFYPTNGSSPSPGPKNTNTDKGLR